MERPACARLVGAAVLIAALVMVLCAALAEVTVKPRFVQLEGFEVVGIEVRANNANEAGPNGVIGKQWQRFMQEGLLDRIPNRADQNILAVYTDYASDANGDYTFVLGAKVRPVADAPVPKGMVIKSVPPDDMPFSLQTAGQLRRLSWKPGSRFGLTTNRPQMASERSAQTSNSTTSVPPIPTTRKWIFTWA